MRQNRSQAATHVRSTLAKLSLCRTAALGEHLYQCESCERRVIVYNSCGDRHCPQCAGAKRRDWLDSSAQLLLLPGVLFYQVVFTIPDHLSALTLGNRQVMFDLLFRSAWRALRQVIENEQEFEAAAAMMLHTWNQHLDAHIHVHAIVPGGGPSLKDPQTWKAARPPAHETQNRFWLVDADELRRAFRTEFLDGLRRLHRSEKLTLAGDWSVLCDAEAFESWLEPMERQAWVTYIQAPPTKDATPELVLKYLARYMTGGPISDRRLVSHAAGQVTFTARTGTTQGGSDATEDVSLPGAEFVRRWALHILPKGYTKSRRYGGYSNHHCRRYLAACRELLPLKESPASSDDENHRLHPEPADRQHRCPQCDVLLTRIAGDAAPSWREVMRSGFCPQWYDDG